MASGTALPWALIILGSSAATMMPIGRLGPRMAAGSLATAAFIVIGVGFTAGDLNEALYGARHAPPGSVLLTYWLSLAFGASLILGWSLPARPGTGGRVLIPIGLVCVGLALWIAAATADVEGPAGILPLIVILTVLGSGLICLVGGGYRLGRATARPGD